MPLKAAVALLVCLMAASAADESRKFPKANLVNTEVVAGKIMGKAFLPGGTLAHYRKGKVEYDMFAAKLASPTAAAIALSDYRSGMQKPVLVPSFGGYFGEDGGKPVFVFTKGAWVLGVRGLAQKEADLQARVLAGQFQ
jgi:hypothetical protein